MFTFLQGQRYRLILFGGRSEIFVDDVSRYRQQRAVDRLLLRLREGAGADQGLPLGYALPHHLPDGRRSRPGPGGLGRHGRPARRGPQGLHATARPSSSWRRCRSRSTSSSWVSRPRTAMPPRNSEQAPGLILDIVRAANGSAASPLAQTLASFFRGRRPAAAEVRLPRGAQRGPEDGGADRAAHRRRPDPEIEKRILLYFVLPLVLFLFVAARPARAIVPGAGRPRDPRARDGRSGPRRRRPLHKLENGGFSRTGLSLSGRRPGSPGHLHLPAPAPRPLRLRASTRPRADATTLFLLPLGLDDLRRSLEAYADEGSKEEKIWALNLDYMAKNLTDRRGRADPQRHRFRAPPHRRRRLPPRQGPPPRQRRPARAS